MITYVNDRIGASKRYSYDQLISVIFNTNNKVCLKQKVRQLDYYLYIAKLYAEKLKIQADIKCVSNYQKTSMLMMSDFEMLVATYEYNKQNQNTFPSLLCGVRKNITPFDLKNAVNELIFLEKCNSVSDLEFRDIQPCAMMVMRQMLELMGKNIIGYDSINDANGYLIKNMTQIAWTFLCKKKNKSTWKLCTPIDLNNIDKLNKWANGYVHNPWIGRSYVRAFALECIWYLMKPVASPITIYDGTSHLRTTYGDIRIDGYNSLKLEFEAYIKTKKSDAVVKWKQISEVEAYILKM